MTQDVPLRVSRSEVLAELGHAPQGRVRVVRSPGALGVRPLIVVRDIATEAMQSPEAAVETTQRILRATDLTHPGCVRIFGTLNVGPRPGVAMELVAGCALPDLPPQALTLATVQHIGAKVAAVLQSLHDGRDALGRPQRLVHGGPTPDKVMLSFGGDVKVLDFGVTRTTARSLSNTLTWPDFLRPYVAPEHTDEATAQSDLYMLGATLYELICGHPPYPQGPGYEPHLWATLPPPSKLRPTVPKALDELVMAMLDPDPTQRPASAQSVREVLDVGPARSAVAQLVRDAALQHYNWLQSPSERPRSTPRPPQAVPNFSEPTGSALPSDSIELLRNSVQQLFEQGSLPEAPPQLALPSGRPAASAAINPRPPPQPLVLPGSAASPNQSWRRPLGLLMVLVAALVLSFATQPAQAPGLLDVRASPPGTTVQVIGHPGSGAVASLPAGIHRLRLTSPGGRISEHIAELMPGEHRVVVIAAPELED